jgi:hypothetical protein
MNENAVLDDNMVRIRVTSNRMKGMAQALESLCDELMTKNPKLFACLAESPLEELRRMVIELDELLEPLKPIPTASASSPPIVENPISTPTSPGPIESTS